MKGIENGGRKGRRGMSSFLCFGEEGRGGWGCGQGTGEKYVYVYEGCKRMRRGEEGEWLQKKMYAGAGGP